MVGVRSIARCAGGAAAGLVFCLLGPAAGDAGAATPAPGLRVIGMTFVGSRGETSELIVRADNALFHPDTGMADLETVHATVSDHDEGESFQMKCDNAELDVKTNDFTATGNVEGVTGDGQTYAAPWVRYDHENAMLFTDAPVVVTDAQGRFRGKGFRYYVDERRFELLGDVSVDQGP